MFDICVVPQPSHFFKCKRTSNKHHPAAATAATGWLKKLVERCCSACLSEPLYAFTTSQPPAQFLFTCPGHRTCSTCSAPRGLASVYGNVSHGLANVCPPRVPGVWPPLEHFNPPPPKHGRPWLPFEGDNMLRRRFRCLG